VTGSFLIESLGSHHDKVGFCSGVAPLDRYLREQAAQDIRRRVTACYVATEAGATIAGYYTLSAGGVLLSDLPILPGGLHLLHSW
jgi:hypothetical protein